MENTQSKDQTISKCKNLYVHFPFCRRKCAYCSLYSRCGVPLADREAYVASLADQVKKSELLDEKLSTIYFGGGSPALCDLRPLFEALNPFLPSDPYEFTVELHPQDVSVATLEMLKAGGVNRISMGVQSLDDATLAAMGRGYTFDEALLAFELVKKYFVNAGIDLIVGYPGEPLCIKEERGKYAEKLKRFAKLGMRHCSVYSLQNERGIKNVPNDDVVLDGVREAAAILKGLWFERYEISNYAVPSYECRHNFAVWRGEDYVGLGEGSCGRLGRTRTGGLKNGEYSSETLPAEEDLKERTIFRLRTRDGLDTTNYPAWRPILDRFVDEGLLSKTKADLPVHANTYYLTARGTEVCDAILAEIV